MKKIILSLLCFLLFIPSSFAFTPIPLSPPPDVRPRIILPPTPEPCTTHPIIINPDIDTNLNNIFEHYADSGSVYYSTAKNEYQLCFQYIDDRYYRNVIPLTFRKKNDGRNVVIKGLKLIRDATLTADEYLLTVINGDTSANVVLDDIHLKDLKYGLYLGGMGEIDLINSELIGTGDNIEPQSCLLIQSMNSKITNNEISNCYYGINISGGSGNQIGATSSASFDSERNIIHNNKIGIYIQDGGLSKFSFNKIYNNFRILDFATSNDAILYDSLYFEFLESAGLEIPKRPVIDPSDRATGKALFCDRDDSGIVIARYLKFERTTVSHGQEIIIYETNKLGLSNQAENYLTKCNINDIKCSITFPESYHVTDDKCGVADLYFVALINDASYTSMLTEIPYILDGVVAVGVSGVGDLPAPALEGVIDEGGAVSDEDITREVEGAAATAETGSGLGTISGIKAGGMCGAMIVPISMNTIVTGLGMWWIITAVPVAILLLVRIKRRK